METTRADAEDRREHRYENPGPIADYPPTLAEQLRDDVAPLIEAWTDNAGSYTCDEADHLAHLIALAIGARPAVAFLAAHCAADEALAAASPDAYAVACAVACEGLAAEQGVATVRDAWQAAGLPACLDQTGGMTMLAALYSADGSGWIWCSADEDEPGRYLLCAYSDDDENGTPIAEHATLAEVLAAATAWHAEHAA